MFAQNTEKLKANTLQGLLQQLLLQVHLSTLNIQGLLSKRMEKAAPENVCFKKEPNSKGLKCKFSSGRETEGKKYPRTGFVQCFADDAEICCKAKEIFVLTTEPKCEIAQMLTDWFKSSQGSPSAELRASSKEKSTVFMNLLCFPLPTHSKSLMSSRSH